VISDDATRTAGVAFDADRAVMSVVDGRAAGAASVVIS